MLAAARTPVISRILVATDLSARSDRAVERAVMLAKQTRAALTILHLVDADLPTGLADRLHDEASAMIANLVRTFQDAEDVSIDIRIVSAKECRNIVDIAEQLGTELIVLGIHRNETIEFFRGTTAERVIRNGVRPVLMVKTRPQAFYRRAIVAIDFSDCSRRAIEFAVRLLPDGEFHLVHAFDVPFKGFLIGDDTLREVSKDHQERMDQFVGEYLARIHQVSQAAPPRLIQVAGQGSVRKVLQQQAGLLKPDLLVLGTHGRSGLAHAMLGSVAEDLLSSPPCDVLAVGQ